MRRSGGIFTPLLVLILLIGGCGQSTEPAAFELSRETALDQYAASKFAHEHRDRTGSNKVIVDAESADAILLVVGYDQATHFTRSATVMVDATGQLFLETAQSDGELRWVTIE